MPDCCHYSKWKLRDRWHISNPSESKSACMMCCKINSDTNAHHLYQCNVSQLVKQLFLYLVKLITSLDHDNYGISFQHLLLYFNILPGRGGQKITKDKHTKKKISWLSVITRSYIYRLTRDTKEIPVLSAIAIGYKRHVEYKENVYKLTWNETLHITKML